MDHTFVKFIIYSPTMIATKKQIIFDLFIQNMKQSLLKLVKS